uniref:Uncharacterized protein n=1 Tax=Leersia perrieri TaxID=77586 RepID=A0A0D9WCC4_9ORYZ
MRCDGGKHGRAPFRPDLTDTRTHHRIAGPTAQLPTCDLTQGPPSCSSILPKQSKQSSAPMYPAAAAASYKCSLQKLLLLLI